MRQTLKIHKNLRWFFFPLHLLGKHPHVWANIRTTYFLGLTFPRPSKIAAADRMTDVDFGSPRPARVTGSQQEHVWTTQADRQTPGNMWVSPNTAIICPTVVPGVQSGPDLKEPITTGYIARGG